MNTNPTTCQHEEKIVLAGIVRCADLACDTVIDASHESTITPDWCMEPVRISTNAILNGELPANATGVCWTDTKWSECRACLTDPSWSHAITGDDLLTGIVQFGAMTCSACAAAS